MMIAEGTLNHFPPPTFACYTMDGDEAAGSSNLALGFAGPVAILTYLNDFGPGNEAVGHRRWLLYPPQMDMGSGSTDGVNGSDVGSSALWVLANSFGPRPAAPQWVAWPPAGFVSSAAPVRWSLASTALDGSAKDFSTSAVSNIERSRSTRQRGDPEHEASSHPDRDSDTLERFHGIL